MAERRMFAKTIIDSDAFLDMPLSTQCLYFHLSMRADDEGFINNPKKVQRMIGASDDDLKVLVAKRFIIPFESGIVVIKHWKIHNYIQADRFKPTVYTEEKALLSVKENKAYTLDTPCIHDVYISDTQVRLGKDSKGKDKQYSQEFEEIWSEYPKKQGKQNALKGYLKARTDGVDKDTILDGIKAYKRYIETQKIESRYIKQGSTWFNQRCWEDDYSVKADKGKFNDFDQRTYDYSELEERLINR